MAKLLSLLLLSLSLTGHAFANGPLGQNCYSPITQGSMSVQCIYDPLSFLNSIGVGTADGGTDLFDVYVYDSDQSTSTFTIILRLSGPRGQSFDQSVIVPAQSIANIKQGVRVFHIPADQGFTLKSLSVSNDSAVKIFVSSEEDSKRK